MDTAKYPPVVQHALNVSEESCKGEHLWVIENLYSDWISAKRNVAFAEKSSLTARTAASHCPVENAVTSATKWLLP